MDPSRPGQDLPDQLFPYPTRYTQTIKVPAAFQAATRTFFTFLRRVGRRYPRPIELKHKYLGRGRFLVTLDDGGHGGLDALLQELILNRGLYYYCCTLDNRASVIDNVVLPVFRELVDRRFQRPHSRFLRKHLLGKHAQTDFVPTEMENSQGAAFDLLMRRWELGLLNNKEYVITLDAILTEFLLTRLGHPAGQKSPEFEQVLGAIGREVVIDREQRQMFLRVHTLSRAALHRLQSPKVKAELVTLSFSIWSYFSYIDDFDYSQVERAVVLRGKRYRRIRYGDEVVEPEVEQEVYAKWGGWKKFTEKRPCGDCGVCRGQLHVEGCDLETCPRCGGQYLGCPCKMTPQERGALTRSIRRTKEAAPTAVDKPR